MLDFIKKHKYLFISLGIAILIFSYYIFFNDSIFLFAGDSYEQQYKFYVEGWYRLRDGSLPFWDWSNFLGNNYFGASTFYFLGSPFFWLVMALPNVDLVQYSFLYINLLKSLICVTFTYMWLYKINKDSLAASIGSLIITFSGYVLFNYTNNHIFDSICFIPLCLYFIECYLQDGKTLGLSLSVGYLGIISYYFLYLFIPFGCIYALVRYLTVTDKPTFKSTFKVGGIFVLRMLLGVLISCITLLPSFLVLQGNPRSEELPSIFSTVEKLSYFRFLTSFLTPICDWRINFNSFVSTNVNPGIGWGGGFADYSLMISIFCLVLLLFIKNKKEKMSIYILLGIYALFFIFKFFYILFNQNYETRWAYVFTFIFAYTVMITISNRTYLKTKHFFISGVVVILTIWLCYIISKLFNLNEIPWEQTFLKRNCIITSIIIVIYVIIFSIFNNKSIFKYLLFIVVFGEIVFSFYSIFYGVNNKQYEPMTKELFDEYNNSYKGATKLIKENDDSFYRIDKEELYDFLGGNDVHLQRYKSFYSYHSIYNYNQLELIETRFTPYWLFKPQTGKDVLKSMFGCKYWFTYEDNYIPPYGYSYYKESSDGGKIYINNYPITFAYFRDKEISKNDFDKFGILYQDYMLLDHVLLDNTSISDINCKVNLLKLVEGVEKESFDISDNNGIYYVEYPKSEQNLMSYSKPNWSIYNANDYELYSSSLSGEYGYVGINISDDKFSNIELRHISRSKVYYDDMSWYDDWYNSQVMVDPDSVVWDDNSISGTITTLKDGYIVTSVPHDSGWTVKLDGKKIDYLKVNEGFVGFTITPGSHTIEMNYVPPGLVVGSIISVVSLIICFLLEKKRKVL